LAAAMGKVVTIPEETRAATTAVTMGRQGVSRARRLVVEAAHVKPVSVISIPSAALHCGMRPASKSAKRIAMVVGLDRVREIMALQMDAALQGCPAVVDVRVRRVSANSMRFVAILSGMRLVPRNAKRIVMAVEPAVKMAVWALRMDARLVKVLAAAAMPVRRVCAPRTAFAVTPSGTMCV